MMCVAKDFSLGLLFFFHNWNILNDIMIFSMSKAGANVKKGHKKTNFKHLVLKEQY